MCFRFASGCALRMDQNKGTAKIKTSGSGRLCRCVAYQVQQLRRQKIPIFCRCGRRFVWSWYVCSMLYNCILKAFCVASGRVRWSVVDNCKGTFLFGRGVLCFACLVVYPYTIIYILYCGVVCVVIDETTRTKNKNGCSIQNQNKQKANK